MVTLKAQGAGRFFAAAILGVWLCGWAFGEGYALWLLGNGAVALMSGRPIGSGPAIAVGGFLVLWLAVWTIAGTAALTELCRLLWGEDRIQAEGGGLSLFSLRGPFRRRREFPRETLRRFLLVARGALAVETSKGTVVLSRLGTLAEREAAVTALRTELGLSDPAPESVPAALPKGWEEIITPEGERAVVPDHAMRRVRARVVGVAALSMAAAAAAVVHATQSQGRMWPFAVQLVLGTIALACAAVWLGRGRMEWRIGIGRATLRRRFGAGVRDVFEAKGFELVLTHDRNDNYDCFALDALSDPPGEAAPLASWTGTGKNRRRITTALRDSAVPRQLGSYLARAANVPLADRTTPEARAANLALLKTQLEQSGPLGRFAVRLVVDVKAKKQG